MVLVLKLYRCCTKFNEVFETAHSQFLSCMGLPGNGSRHDLSLPNTKTVICFHCHGLTSLVELASVCSVCSPIKVDVHMLMAYIWPASMSGNVWSCHSLGTLWYAQAVQFWNKFNWLTLGSHHPVVIVSYCWMEIAACLASHSWECMRQNDWWAIGIDIAGRVAYPGVMFISVQQKRQLCFMWWCRCMLVAILCRLSCLDCDSYLCCLGYTCKEAGGASCCEWSMVGVPFELVRMLSVSG